MFRPMSLKPIHKRPTHWQMSSSWPCIWPIYKWGNFAYRLAHLKNDTCR